jgi:hypothetical protein
VLWNMLRPPVDEFLDSLASRFVVGPGACPCTRSDDSVRDRNYPSFCDWRAPHVTAGETQEMLFSVEGLHVHFPMPNFLVLEETFDLVVTHL